MLRRMRKFVSANRLVWDQIWVMMACPISAKLVVEDAAKRSQE